MNINRHLKISYKKIRLYNFLMLFGFLFVLVSCQKGRLIGADDLTSDEVIHDILKGTNLISKNVDSSIVILRNLTDKVYKLNDPRLVAKLHKEIALAYFVKGYFNLSVEEYTHALVSAKQAGDLDLESRILNNIGVCYTKISEYQNAINTFSELMILCKKIDDIEGYYMCLLNQADLNCKLGLFDLARLQLNEVTTYFTSLNKSNILAVAYQILGNIEGKQGEISKEIKNYHKAIEIFTFLKDTASYTSAVRELSLAYARIGDETNSLKYYHIRCSLNGSIDCDVEKGDALLLLGDINYLFNRKQEAIKPYQDAYNYFREKGNEIMRLNALKKLISSMSQVGIRDSFRNLFAQYDSLQTQLYEKQNIEKVAELSLILDTKLNHEKLENEKRNRRKSEQNFYAILFISIGLFAILIILAILYFRINNLYKELFHKNIELLEKQDEAIANLILPQPEQLSAEKTLLSEFNKILLDDGLYSDPGLSLPLAASKLGTNQRYLSFVINQSTGQNFNTYVNKIRINIAQQKILAQHLSQIPVNEELALQVGFSTRQTFIRAFKQFTGLNPAQYKEFAKINDSTSNSSNVSQIEQVSYLQSSEL